jgi:hypothetical protein
VRDAVAVRNRGGTAAGAASAADCLGRTEGALDGRIASKAVRSPTWLLGMDADGRIDIEPGVIHAIIRPHPLTARCR